MKYFIRAVKYFFYFIILFSAILGIFILLKMVEPSPESLFRDGWKSVGQILGLFALVAAVYPKIAYATRTARAAGDPSETGQALIALMEDRGYLLEGRDGDTMMFRLSSTAGRARRMWEDRVTVTRTMEGYALEGPNKDIVRLINALEMKFNPNQYE